MYAASAPALLAKAAELVVVLLLAFELCEFAEFEDGLLHQLTRELGPCALVVRVHCLFDGQEICLGERGREAGSVAVTLART